MGRLATMIGGRPTTHHPLYSVWSAMKARCRDNHGDYRNYGARGISVCDRWRDSFTAFIADVGPRPDKRFRGSNRVMYSLDRINNDGNYEPGNVRWADAAQQRSNQRLRSVTKRVRAAD